MLGNADRSSAVAGVSFVPNVERSTRNGCCTRNEAVLTCSVEGDSAIVCSNAFGSREIASNVVAISVNNRAFVAATGATVPMNPSSELKNRVKPVFGSDRYVATGVKC
jgi:hypothetical protein